MVSNFVGQKDRKGEKAWTSDQITEIIIVSNIDTKNLNVLLFFFNFSFWGTEKYVLKDFQKQFPDSVVRTEVGFMSPEENAVENPSYRQVCTGETGHVEVLDVELKDPDKTFEELIRFFFMFHDPTTKNRQGNDVGTQYASAIFCSDEQQIEIATRVKEELQAAVDKGKVKYQKSKVETFIAPYTKFYPAEEDHQQYLMKNPLGYCNHRFRFTSWPEVN